MSLPRSLATLQAMIPFFDPQMVVVMLPFWLEQRSAALREADLFDGLLQLRNTLVISHTACYELLGEESEDIKKKKAVLESRYSAALSKAGPLLTKLFREDSPSEYVLNKEATAQFQEDDRIPIDRVGNAKSAKALLEMARCIYMTGNTPTTKELLQGYLLLSDPEGTAVSDEERTMARWGMLACAILTKDWICVGSLAEDLFKEATTDTERTILLHWVLFLSFKGSNHSLSARDKSDKQLIITWMFRDFSKDKYVAQNCVEVCVPHLLRYVCALLLMWRYRSRTDCARIMEIISRHPSCQQDVIVRALMRVYNYDTADLTDLLAELKQDIDADYFLSEHKATILDGMRKAVMHAHLTSHRNVSMETIVTISAPFDPPANENTEQWVVDLVCQVKLQAKIDSAAKRITLTAKPHDVITEVLNLTESVR